MSNTAIGRKIHAPDSHRWKPLPWFCLLRQRPWFYFHITYQLSQISHRLSYNCSMLEYKVIKFPPWLFSTISNTAICRKTHTPNSHQWKKLPWFCILRRWPWTFQLTVGATVEWQWSNSSSISNCLYPFWAWHEIFTSGVAVEQHQFNFELFVPSLGLTWNIHFLLFCWNGLIPNSDFGQL